MDSSRLCTSIFELGEREAKLFCVSGLFLVLLLVGLGVLVLLLVSACSLGLVWSMNLGEVVVAAEQIMKT